MTEPYAKTIKERMASKYPDELFGGLHHGKPYPHIFKHLEDNFIDGSYPEKKCLKGDLTDVPIKYNCAEHLNSSQTMCIAYFKKFFEADRYEPLLAEILMMQGIDLSGCSRFTDAVFEYVPYAKENTNFDFFLRLDTGKQITWEVKFTETEFRSINAKNGIAQKYIDKYNNIYRPMIDASIYKDGCSMSEFYEQYQIHRNILYAKDPDDYVLFLTPRENESLNEDRKYIEAFAQKQNTAHIKNIYWEELLDVTLRVVKCESELFDYYSKFKDKYLVS